MASTTVQQKIKNLFSNKKTQNVLDAASNAFGQIIPGVTTAKTASSVYRTNRAANQINQNLLNSPDPNKRAIGQITSPLYDLFTAKPYQELVGSAARVGTLAATNNKIDPKFLASEDVATKIGSESPLQLGGRVLSGVMVPLMASNPAVAAKAASYRLFPSVYGAGNAAFKGENVLQGATKAVYDYASPSLLAQNIPGIGNRLAPNTPGGNLLDTAEMAIGLFANKGIDDIALDSLFKSKLATKVASKLPGMNFTMDKLTRDELVQAEEMIKYPDRFIGKISTGARTEKEALKVIRANGMDTLERLAAKYLPDKQLNKLKSPEAIIKALTDLSSQNRLANVNLPGDNRVVLPKAKEVDLRNAGFKPAKFNIMGLAGDSGFSTGKIEPNSNVQKLEQAGMDTFTKIENETKLLPESIYPNFEMIDTKNKRLPSRSIKIKNAQKQLESNVREYELETIRELQDYFSKPSKNKSNKQSEEMNLAFMALRKFREKNGYFAKNIGRGDVSEAISESQKQLGINLEEKTIADIENIIHKNNQRLDDFITGNKSGYGRVSTKLRQIEENLSITVGKMTESNNPYVRAVGNSLRGFGANMGKNKEQVNRTLQFKGQEAYARQMAVDVQKYIYGLLGGNKKSLVKVFNHLDPELATEGVAYEKLSSDEKEAVNVLKVISDYINDTNYKNGFISEQNWQKNRGGKYLARAYEPFEYPQELNSFIKRSGLKLQDDLYKARGDVTEWKKANALRDPAYLVAKRLQQTMFNDAVLKMSNSLKGTSDVSSVPAEGFVKLSDSKLYGDLAGQYIRKSVYEDIVGFFSTHKGLQSLLDTVDAYDKAGPRQAFKKVLTVYNPGTVFGNITSNPIFGWLNGIPPQKLLQNTKFANNQVENSGPLYRYLMKNGILGSDIFKKDMGEMSSRIRSELNDQGLIGKINEIDQKVINSYGKVDDVAKIAAFKYWLDSGYSAEAAAERVSRGFQNYSMVGYLYHVGAKMPIIGNPFVRFKGDWMRMIKNAAIDHPFRLGATLIAWEAFTRIMSSVSGESEQDRKTREGRLGASRIPFTNISTSIQTPFGEINASRLLGSVSYNDINGNSMTGDLSDYSPIPIPQKNQKTGKLYGFANDPLLGPLASIGFDTDFRGKSISDPNENKYAGSLLTPIEKRINQAGFLKRSYTPAAVNQVEDIVKASAGKEDFYGRKLTPTQAFLRFIPGVKLETFGPQEAQKQRNFEQTIALSGAESIKRQIGAVENQVLRGEISQEDANRRIKYLEGQRSSKLVQSGLGSISRDGDVYKMLVGDEVKKIDVGKVSSMPESNNFEKSIKKQEAFKLVDDVIKYVPKTDQAEIFNKLGITPTQGYYYYIAGQNTDTKVAFTQDVVGSLGDRESFIKFLVQGRSEINNKMFSSNAVLDELAALNMITNEEKNLIKKIKYNGGQLTVKVNVTKSRVKALKLTAPKRIKISSSTKSRAKIKPIKLQGTK